MRTENSSLLGKTSDRSRGNCSIHRAEQALRGVIGMGEISAARSGRRCRSERVNFVRKLPNVVSGFDVSNYILCRTATDPGFPQWSMAESGFNVQRLVAMVDNDMKVSWSADCQVNESVLMVINESNCEGILIRIRMARGYVSDNRIDAAFPKHQRPRCTFPSPPLKYGVDSIGCKPWSVVSRKRCIFNEYCISSSHR